jgi:hypothetical protein
MKMSYALFIDDLRIPKTVSPCEERKIVRTSGEAISYVKEHGVPNYISFDHDLGGEDTAIKFVDWLIEYDLDGHINISNLMYHVHSANPVGKLNIESKLNSYLKYKKLLDNLLLLC